jgi:replicative DNA helicase
MIRPWPEQAERSVLAAILAAACVDPDAGLRTLRRARNAGLAPEHFGRPAYGTIYRTLLELADQGLPIGPAQVEAELDTDAATRKALDFLAADIAPFRKLEEYVNVIARTGARV